ncbi:hypothetical protein BASA82_000019 [Batrachochytrium salamandrivorans]|nr:hypothetical protein BASA82_000019 [Batrachochytrium salamandrivorans]
MGEFERPRHRGTESFLIPDPAWGRYIKFQVLSTHGKEMYCTLTSIKVYGQTTIETLREDLALAQQHPNTVHDQQPPSSDPANCSVQDLESIFYISWTPSPTTTATTTTTAATAATTATESPVTDVSVIPPPFLFILNG